MSDALTAAIEHLPVHEGARDRIQHWATRLAILGELQGFMDAAPARSVGSDATRKEVDAFIKLAIPLCGQIAAMHRNSLSAFEREDVRHPLLVADDLRKMIRAVSGADIAPKAPVQGRRTMRGPKVIAKAAAAAYSELTGEKPTVRTNTKTNIAYGPFLVFLSEVLKALDIKASAEALAREVVKEK